MNISWQYLDKRAASADALKDYGSMKAIITNSKEAMARARARMTGVSSPVYSDMPKSPPQPHAGETRILQGMEALDVLKERHRQAAEYMAWFQPAWDALTEDERTVLQLFYQTEDAKQIDAVTDICERFHIERSSAYKKKDRALARLALLLYGK